MADQAFGYDRPQPRYPADDRSIGIMAAFRRSEIASISKEMLRDGSVNEELFNVPEGLPTDWNYVQAAALLATIALSTPRHAEDVYRIAAEALPDFTPRRAAEITDICLSWSARVRGDEASSAP